jgi:hypothetical protein
MIKEALYGKMRLKYGDVASWAVWEPEGDRPKSNMGPQNVFNLEANPLLLESLRNNVVMVGLNFPREVRNAPPFSNFHDESPYANDFKIRYAFRGTPYYGAYMTDVLKGLVIPAAKSVRDHVRNNPGVAESHVRAFEEELDDLGSDKPILLAFGHDAYGLLHRHLDKRRYGMLIEITHYSHRVPKEKYGPEVLSRIAETME